jgi:hypothetical protein
MDLSLKASDLIAIGAFVLSAYATWMTFRFNQKQKRLIESQESLNKLLMDKEHTEIQNAQKADLGASFVKIGSNSHRLKIWNKGKSPARNVGLEFPEGNECLSQSDIESKFPLELLDPHQSVELIAMLGMQSKSKHPIRLIWSDGFSDRNEKLVYPTT